MEPDSADHPLAPTAAEPKGVASHAPGPGPDTTLVLTDVQVWEGTGGGTSSESELGVRPYPRAVLTDFTPLQNSTTLFEVLSNKVMDTAMMLHDSVMRSNMAKHQV